MKLIALYDPPADPEAFDRQYFGSHIPLLDKVPGLQSTTVTRFSHKVMGREMYMMAEMVFDDAESLKQGLNSPEMAAAGDNLNTFAEGLVTLLIGEAI
ncbi:MAG: EthD family reductase [Anaerolineales bacterium]